MPTVFYPDYYTYAEIYAPEWYQRADFLMWLSCPHTATWYNSNNQTLATDFADAFVVYDAGTSLEFGNQKSNNPLRTDVLPKDIEEYIIETFGNEKVIIRILNLSANDE